jgi:MFS superfamily sulfate permease-like transporter
MSINNNYKRVFFVRDFFRDLSSGIVVFLIALPLCLGIALVSGAPFFSGIVAGIVGGTVVTLISKSSLGVSGPGAGLAVLVLFFIKDLGSFEAFVFAVILAGVIQVVLGCLGAGVLAYYFPSSVISGMLSGIGILILLKQIPHIFGYDADPEGDFFFSQVDNQNTLSELFNLVDFISYGPLLISVVSLFILIYMDKRSKTIKSLLDFLPAPLLVVTVGVVLNLFFANNKLFSLEEDHLVSIKVIDSLSGFWDLFITPDFSQWNNYKVYVAAVVLAVVASIETLLCVEATDKLDPKKRVTPTSLELIAQGIGNIFSGFLGGLPVTQVIVRSSANIQAGGQTRLSSFSHGVFLFIAVLFFSKVINLIPISSLASILFLVGYKLFKPSYFIEMYRKGWFHFVPFVVTIGGIVFSDLLTGVLLGLLISFFEIIWYTYKVPFSFCPNYDVKGNSINIKLSENISFLNKPKIMISLEHLPDGSDVVLDASKTRSIHPDVLIAIYDFTVLAKSRNIKIRIENYECQRSSDPVGLFKKSFATKSNFAKKSEHVIETSLG